MFLYRLSSYVSLWSGFVLFIHFTLAKLCQLIHVGKIWQVCIFMITTSQNLKTDQLSALRETRCQVCLSRDFFFQHGRHRFGLKEAKKRTLDDLLYSSNLTSCQGTGISYFFRLALLGVKEKVFDIIMRISILLVFESQKLKKLNKNNLTILPKTLSIQPILKAHYFHISIILRIQY